MPDLAEKAEDPTHTHIYITNTQTDVPMCVHSTSHTLSIVPTVIIGVTPTYVPCFLNLCPLENWSRYFE